MVNTRYDTACGVSSIKWHGFFSANSLLFFLKEVPYYCIFIRGKILTVSVYKTYSKVSQRVRELHGKRHLPPTLAA